MDSQQLGSGEISNARQLAGGTQNILFRFSRNARDFVLRRPPQHLRAGSNETMRREARVLAALAGSTVPHPPLIAACDDETVLGATFYLMEPVEGFNPLNGLPATHHDAESQHRMGLAAIQGLASLHALDLHAVGLDNFGKLDQFLERQTGRWAAQLASYADLAGWPGPHALGDVAAVAIWLDRHRPATFTPGILHGDFHLANVMFRPDKPELAAIVDWELATIGDPLIDLGWLLATWPQQADGGLLSISPWTGFPSAAELVAHYAAHSNRDTSHIGWHAVFACYKLGIILEGTYARACAGKAPVETGDTLHRRAQWLFTRARRWMAHGFLAGES